MKFAVVLKSVLKIALLTLLMAVLFMVGAAVTGIAASAGAGSGSAAGGQGLLLILVVSFVDTALLCYFVVRSRLTGLALVAATAFMYYGVKTFTAQLETAYFMNNVPRSMLPQLFAMTIPMALVFPPVAALLFGKLRRRPAQDEPPAQAMPLSEWLWKALLIGAVVYPVLFFGAGYFIAWRNPDVRAFYGGVDNPNVLAYYADMFARDPKVYPFEILRGLLWFALALPVLRTMRGGFWEKALFVALTFALIENAQHLFPNPLMPASVRLSHFVETASSNFIFGLAVTAVYFWRMTRRPEAAPQPEGSLAAR